MYLCLYLYSSKSKLISLSFGHYLAVFNHQLPSKLYSSKMTVLLFAMLVNFAASHITSFYQFLASPAGQFLIYFHQAQKTTSYSLFQHVGIWSLHNAV